MKNAPMKTFLEEIACQLVEKYGNVLGAVTVIFPNRRAGLYFREHLKKLLAGPVWSPQILSFQDFIAAQCDTQVADKLFLIHQLFEDYTKVIKTKEGFDRFFYWGQMLIKDFDDIDKYLINARNLYTNLSRQKQLDLTFDYLTSEQKAIIQKFWQGFDKSKSEQKENFMFVWERLYDVYSTFQQSLRKQNIAYEGMQYRWVAENIDRISFKNIDGPVIFAGFNALNLAEEKIISWFMQNHKTQIIWDVDEYYMEDAKQEAGRFLRMYRSSNVFAPSFPAKNPAFLQDPEKKITITGVPQHVGQAKLLGQKLGDLLRDKPDIDLKKIAVVLADEALLFPVLHSLPDEVGAINVTMGFPLAYAPVNSLLEHILELQRTLRRDPDGLQLFHYRHTLSILRHPLLLPFETKAFEKMAGDIEKNNKVFLTGTDFLEIPIIQKIFKDAGDGLISYLSEILLDLHLFYEKLDRDIEVEYIHHFYQILNRYGQLLETEGQKAEVKAFAKLFRQLVRSERLSFTGEPLRGLQIMGVLETRNLDFEHVFVLSMNEDFFPAQGGRHSFIPYNLRKGYDLPNYDQQDAMYAYLFYRLLQRPRHIDLFYNTEGNDLGGEEMSRYLQQLIHESGLAIGTQVLASYTASTDAPEIVVEKDEQVMQSLARFIENDGQRPKKRLSPSALSTYLDCRLMFYLRHVADLYEKDGMDEDVDARSLGNVLHYAMEVLYEDHIRKKGSRWIKKHDVKALKKGIDEAVLKAFRKQFSVGEDRNFFFEGKNIIAREIVKDFMQSVLKLDEKYTPFEFTGAEKKFEYDLKIVAGVQTGGEDTEQKWITVGLRGTIDRLDKKDGHVRLIDYKTGKDKHNFASIEELFDRKKKNKAAFQTFYYALLYRDVKQPEEIMTPAVFNKNALFQGEDVLLHHKTMGKVKNAALHLDEYTERLKALLSEIFDPQVPFDQTDDDQKCTYCAYNRICGRG